MIRIVLLGASAQTGEGLKGTVTWRAESKAARKIEIVCRWRVEGKGRTREEVVARVEHADPPPEATIPFELEIPIWGPLTYDGKLLRITWEVEASADLPMARDERERLAFTVVPRPWSESEWRGADD